MSFLVFFFLFFFQVLNLVFDKMAKWSIMSTSHLGVTATREGKVINSANLTVKINIFLILAKRKYFEKEIFLLIV